MMNFECEAGFFWFGDGGVAVQIHTNNPEVLKALMLTLPSWVVVTLEDLAVCNKAAAVREFERITQS